MNFIDDIKEVAKTESGKRLLMTLLDRTGADEVKAYCEPRYEAYQNGKREVGMDIYNALCSSREGLDVIYEWRLKKQETPVADTRGFYDNFIE